METLESESKSKANLVTTNFNYCAAELNKDDQTKDLQRRTPDETCQDLGEDGGSGACCMLHKKKRAWINTMGRWEKE